MQILVVYLGREHECLWFVLNFPRVNQFQSIFCPQAASNAVVHCTVQLELSVRVHNNMKESLSDSICSELLKEPKEQLGWKIPRSFDVHLETNWNAAKTASR